MKKAIQCRDIETIKNHIGDKEENEKEALLEYAMQLHPEDGPVVIIIKHYILFDAIDCEDLEKVKRYLHWTHLEIKNHVTPMGVAQQLIMDDDHPIMKTMYQYLHQRMVTPFLVHLEKTLSKHYLYDKNAFKQVISLSRGRRLIWQGKNHYYLYP